MSHRVQKVNQLLKKELGRLLLREGDFPRDVLVTITRVESAADLKSARVYVSVIPETKTQRVLQRLNRGLYDLQRKLYERLKMRPVPQLQFVQEEKTREAGRIEELLARINQGNH